MKKALLFICLVLAHIGGGKAQDNVAYYGLSPATTPPVGNISAIGSGLNNYVAAAVALDPATDPVVQRLKGQQILGVRCYLREANKYKRQGRSFVMLGKESPDAAERKQLADFEAGWNDVYFDEPYTIGDEKLFVGFQAYETKGSPYPAVTFKGVAVPGGCFTNVARAGWNEYSDRGVLLIQAILSADAAPLLERAAYVKATNYPLTVEPSKQFDCQIYVHNISAQPLSSLSLSTQGKGDEEPYVQTLNFDTPLAAYEGRMVPAAVHAGSEEGASQDLTLKAVQFNGEEAQAAQPGVSQLYVTVDAFTRIPLIEEFTGLTCSNCPFMAYYLDMALEEYQSPVIYVAHHAGFQDDPLTQPVDKQLIYLFGPEYGPDYKYGYNPAIMYDRTILKGETVPVLGASGEPSHEPYLAAIREAATYPALAQVFVDADKSDDGALSVTVHGRVHRDLVASGETIYVSTYLIEDGITTAQYPQLGLDAEDAPEDLLERFRHNGVIRYNFCTIATGDVLEAEDDATFSVSYPATTVSDGWKWENCQVVSFVHRIDKENLSGNVVLNAGSNKLNAYLTGIESAPTAGAADAASSTRAYAGPDRRIRTSDPSATLQVYDLRGCRLNAAAAQQPGVYVVRITNRHGQTSAQKVLVR